MYYRKPHYYHDFCCTANQCPDTCCAGWQIVIDEDSLERYSNETGEFGLRLLNSIDWSEGIFTQNHKRCSFLNDENLCDIYKELGADALCDTCRMYPRHVEEFEERREFSLSLSCPVAAEMILGCRETVRFLEEEDDIEECEEDYEDFDFLLFGQLEDARELILNVLQNREIDVSKRIYVILKLSDVFQKALDNGMLFEINLEEEMEGFLAEENQKKVAEKAPEILLQTRIKMLGDLQKLEVLREEWPAVLENLEKNLYGNGADFYNKKRAEFLTFIAENIGREQWEIYKEQLLVFFIFTYFCGAVYDDMIYTKTVLAVFSTLWIEELLLAKWMENGQNLDFSDVVKVSCQYAREIEHSDENLNLLEEFFDENELYTPESLQIIL